MIFTNTELKVIYALFNTFIFSLENKKGHKNKNEIITLEQMKKINKKINDYMEENENEISR